MRWISAPKRALIFAVVTSCTIVAMVSHSYAMLRTQTYPQPTFIGSTAYGAILTFLIPLSFAWFAIGLRTRAARIAGLMGTLALVLVWLAYFAESMRFVGKDPWDPATWWS